MTKLLIKNGKIQLSRASHKAVALVPSTDCPCDPCSQLWCVATDDGTGTLCMSSANEPPGKLEGPFTTVDACQAECAKYRYWCVDTNGTRSCTLAKTAPPGTVNPTGFATQAECDAVCNPGSVNKYYCTFDGIDYQCVFTNVRPANAIGPAYDTQPECEAACRPAPTRKCGVDVQACDAPPVESCINLQSCCGTTWIDPCDGTGSVASCDGYATTDTVNCATGVPYEGIECYDGYDLGRNVWDPDWTYEQSDPVFPRPMYSAPTCCTRYFPYCDCAGFDMTNMVGVGGGSPDAATVIAIGLRVKNSTRLRTGAVNNNVQGGIISMLFNSDNDPLLDGMFSFSVEPPPQYKINKPAGVASILKLRIVGMSVYNDFVDIVVTGSYPRLLNDGDRIHMIIEVRGPYQEPVQGGYSGLYTLKGYINNEQVIAQPAIRMYDCDTIKQPICGGTLQGSSWIVTQFGDVQNPSLNFGACDDVFYTRRALFPTIPP